MIEGIYLQNNIKTGFANHAEKQNITTMEI